MHEITLHAVPANRNEPVTHTFHFPKEWKEVDRNGLIAIAAAQLSSDRETALKFTLLRELAGIPAELMELMPPAEDLTWEVDTTDHSGPWRPVYTSEMRLLPQLDWVKTAPLYHASLIPTLEWAQLTWQGPQSGFDRMTLNQWVWCTELLQAFRKEKEGARLMEQLHLLLGALYQPDYASWSPEPIEEYAAKLAGLPNPVKLAAVMNYEAILSTLPNQYPLVFAPSDGGTPSPQGLFSLAHDAAKSGAFVNYGGPGLVEDKELHLVLGYMEHVLHGDHQAELRARAAASRNKKTLE